MFHFNNHHRNINRTIFQVVSCFNFCLLVIDFGVFFSTKQKFCLFHCSDTLGTSLCSVSSLLHVENQGRQHIPAIPQNLNAPRTTLYTVEAFFPAVRKIFPSIGWQNKRSCTQSPLKGMREPICDSPPPPTPPRF